MLAVAAVAQVWTPDLPAPHALIIEAPARPGGAREAYPTSARLPPHNKYSPASKEIACPREHRKSAKFFARAAAPRGGAIGDMVVDERDTPSPTNLLSSIKFYMSLINNKKLIRSPQNLFAIFVEEVQKFLEKMQRKVKIFHYYFKANQLFLPLL